MLPEPKDKTALKMIKNVLLSSKSSWLVVNTFILILLGNVLVAQECEISSDVPMPVCKGNWIKLSVPESADYTYLWSPGGETTADILIKPQESKQYQVTVTNRITLEQCVSIPFLVELRPTFNTEIEQLQLTCSNGDNENGNNAMLQASASGDGSPFIYRWDVRPIQIAPDNPSLAIGLKAHQWYFIEIENSNGCVQRDSIKTLAYKNPIVELGGTDPDTAYIQNPYVNFSFENLSADSIEITNYFWDFGDESPTSDLLTPQHLYIEEGDYSVFLTVNNPQGCDTIYTKGVKILPVKLKIPNVITPNGDDINDYFIITEDAGGSDIPETLKGTEYYKNYKILSKYYKKTTLVIFNRQGRKILESSDYQNDWNGGNLKDGVYFYVLQCEGFKSNEVYRGSITIFGKNN